MWYKWSVYVKNRPRPKRKRHWRTVVGRSFPKVYDIDEDAFSSAHTTYALLSSPPTTTTWTNNTDFRLFSSAQRRCCGWRVFRGSSTPFTNTHSRTHVDDTLLVPCLPAYRTIHSLLALKKTQSLPLGLLRRADTHSMRDWFSARVTETSKEEKERTRLNTVVEWEGRHSKGWGFSESPARSRF